MTLDVTSFSIFIVDNFTRLCYYENESIVKHSTLKGVVK